MNFLEHIRAKEINFIFEYSPSAKSSVDKYSRDIELLKNRVFVVQKGEALWNFKRFTSIISALLKNNLTLCVVSPKNETPYVVKKLKKTLYNRNILLFTNWDYGQLTNSTIICKDNLIRFTKRKFVALILNPEKNIKIVKEFTAANMPIIASTTSNMNDSNFLAVLHLNLTGGINLIKFFAILGYMGLVRH